MKKFHLSMTFTFLLPSPFWFPVIKIVLPTQFFGNFIFPLQKKKWNWEGVKIYMYSSKNLIFVCFYVLLLEQFDVLWMFLLLSAMFDTAFYKSIQNLHFYDQIKQKTGNRFHFRIDQE